MARYRRASEVGEYVYCARAWWLHHVQGHAPSEEARLSRGEAAHDAHATTLGAARWLRWVALLLALLGVALLVGQVANLSY